MKDFSMSKVFSPSPLFERVERARRRKHKFRDTQITLAHGSGGRAMHELIEGLFLEYLSNPLLEKLEDQAVFEIGVSSERLAGSTNNSQVKARVAGNPCGVVAFRLPLTKHAS
jgi:hydrogenase expression/formation protein HypE